MFALFLRLNLRNGFQIRHCLKLLPKGFRWIVITLLCNPPVQAFFSSGWAEEINSSLMVCCKGVVEQHCIGEPKPGALEHNNRIAWESYAWIPRRNDFVWIEPPASKITLQSPPTLARIGRAHPLAWDIRQYSHPWINECFIDTVRISVEIHLSLACWTGRHCLAAQQTWIAAESRAKLILGLAVQVIRESAFDYCLIWLTVILIRRYMRRM